MGKIEWTHGKFIHGCRRRLFVEKGIWKVKRKKKKEVGVSYFVTKRDNFPVFNLLLPVGCGGDVCLENL